MKREQLERKINDAADGLLNDSELRKLEQDLEHHPGLMQTYRDILDLPDLSKAYRNDRDAHRNDLAVHQIKTEIDRIWEQSASFEKISLVWFRKYALVASLLVFALTSLYYMTEPPFGSEKEVMPYEYFYPYEESRADDYVLYLEEWFEQ